jgi:hypothetical protein
MLSLDWRLPLMEFEFVAHSKFNRLFVPTLAGLIGLYPAIFI